MVPPYVWGTLMLLTAAGQLLQWRSSRRNGWRHLLQGTGAVLVPGTFLAIGHIPESAQIAMMVTGILVNLAIFPLLAIEMVRTIRARQQQLVPKPLAPWKPPPTSPATSDS